MFKPRNKAIPIRFNGQELESIRKEANRQDLKISTFIRQAILKVVNKLTERS